MENSPDSPHGYTRYRISKSREFILKRQPVGTSPNLGEVESSGTEAEKRGEVQLFNRKQWREATTDAGKACKKERIKAASSPGNKPGYENPTGSESNKGSSPIWSPSQRESIPRRQLQSP